MYYLLSFYISLEKFNKIIFFLIISIFYTLVNKNLENKCKDMYQALKYNFSDLPETCKDLINTESAKVLIINKLLTTINIIFYT